MSRSERLLALLQVLRRHRRPVAGRALAQELGISMRTLYRDIATLQAQGADIAGEPGLGYLLRPGFMLPPLMFSEAEIEALVLGSRWVAKLADEPLAAAAGDALAKIAAVLPDDLRDRVDDTPLLVGPRTTASGQSAPSGPSRWAISRRRGCWRPGARRAGTSAISGPTASSPCPRPARATRAGGWRC